MYTDSNSKQVHIDNKDVLMCPTLKQHIMSVPSWFKQLALCGYDPASIHSFGNYSILCQANFVKTINHHPNKGSLLICALPLETSNFAVYLAVFPCYSAANN